MDADKIQHLIVVKLAAQWDVNSGSRVMAVSHNCYWFSNSICLSFLFFLPGGSDGLGSCHLSTFGLEACRVPREAFPPIQIRLHLASQTPSSPSVSEASEYLGEKNGRS